MGEARPAKQRLLRTERLDAGEGKRFKKRGFAREPNDTEPRRLAGHLNSGCIEAVKLAPWMACDTAANAVSFPRANLLVSSRRQRSREETS